jgi:hypothetical protein
LKRFIFSLTPNQSWTYQYYEALHNDIFIDLKRFILVDAARQWKKRLAPRRRLTGAKFRRERHDAD